MRILCARYPHLGLITALRRFPELRGEPVIVGGAPELRLPVIAMSAAAARSGVRPGQPLRQAQQRCPGAAFVALDQQRTASLRDEACARLRGLTPMVEVGDEEAFCDLTGRHAAYDDEARWGVAVARALAAVLDSEPPAVGIAGSRFVARMAAQQGRPGHVRRIRHGEESAFLAPLPLAVLPVDGAVTARLADFGMDCLGAAASLSPAELQRQFGPAGLEVHRLLRGEDGDGVHAETVQQRWSERVVLEPPVAQLEQLLAAARACAQSLGERLQERAFASGEVHVIYELEDADDVDAGSVLAAPAGAMGVLWTAVLGLLGELHPAAPVSAVRVELMRIGPASGRQSDLLRPGDTARESIVTAAIRLRARFGDTAARRPRLAVDPGDLPERRFVWESPGMQPVSRGRTASAA